MAELLGIHFEGPFISRTRRGVHPEQWIAGASPELFRQLLDAARGRARILTLAPELPGALAVVDAARSVGIVVRSVTRTQPTNRPLPLSRGGRATRRTSSTPCGHSAIVIPVCLARC